MLTLVDSQTFFDDKARQFLGISGDTFIEPWYSGRYEDIPDDPDHSDIMYLTLLGSIGRSGGKGGEYHGAPTPTNT